MNSKLYCNVTALRMPTGPGNGAIESGVGRRRSVSVRVGNALTEWPRVVKTGTWWW